MKDEKAAAVTMPDWLGHRAASLGDRLALIAGDERLTFADLEHQVAQTARRLVGLGMVAGVRVALLLRNGAPFVVLTHALARLGAVMVPLNTRLAAPEAAWQLADSRASYLVHDDALAPVVEAACQSLPGLVSLSARTVAQAREADVQLHDRIDLSALQGIIYTSATSGRPKGVMLSFGNHWWNAVGSALNLGFLRDDRWLAPLPLYHVGGLAILWRSVIYGIPAVVHEGFDPEAVNRAIDEDGVTIASVVSTMLQRMLDARGDRPYPPSLRCVLLGGGSAPAALLVRCLRAGVPVAPTYGLTEAASQVATLPPEDVARKPGSAGKVLFPAEVKIEDGEILIRGPSVMLGYAGRPDETARALRGGWLHTGDLGRLDGEGYLYVAERSEDLIISGGENVYPAEVEAVLVAHPGVEDAGVIGLPDAEWGQVVAAAVRPRSGIRLSAAEVQAFCRDRLAGYKVPRRIWFVDELPRSPSGKLVRRILRDQVPASARQAGE